MSGKSSPVSDGNQMTIETFWSYSRETSADKHGHKIMPDTKSRPDPNIPSQYFFEFSPIGSIQTWTVPATGIYHIKALGSCGGPGGGPGDGTPGGPGGCGAVAAGTFPLTTGDVLQILVGSFDGGGYQNSGGPGGGGSYVVLQSTGAPLVVAGGGGGGGGVSAAGIALGGITARSISGSHASTTTLGSAGASSGGAGGSEGGGGGAGGMVANPFIPAHGGGGGFSGDGQGTGGGKSFRHGGGGGRVAAQIPGGFGGGGGGGWSGGGGGGGSSGGGGGGGSFVAATSTTPPVIRVATLPERKGQVVIKKTRPFTESHVLTKMYGTEERFQLLVKGEIDFARYTWTRFWIFSTKRRSNWVKAPEARPRMAAYCVVPGSTTSGGWAVSEA